MDARRTNLVAAAALGAAGFTFATTTAITSGLPDIARDLDATQSEIQYVQDVYTVVLGALVLPAGALLDRYGRRRGMVVGLAILTVCQLWSALAGSPTELILSRAVAGAGAALVLPGTLATITAVIPTEQRSRAVALWAGSTMFGAGVGMLVAGACLEAASWQASSVVIAALALATLAFVVAVVPETYDPEHAHVDPVGAVLSCVGFAALIVAAIELPVEGAGSAVVVAGFAVGTAFMAAFVWWELRNPRPLLELRLFTNPSFAVGAVAIFLVFVAGYGWFFLIFQYFAYVLDYGPFRSGLGLLPLLLALIPAAMAGPRLAGRYGRRNVISAALVVVALAAAIMAAAAETDLYWPMGIGILLFGVGIGLGQSPPTEAIVEALPDHQQGVASAVNDSAREVGASVGVALMGSLFNFGYRGEVGDALQGVGASVSGAVEEGPAAGVAGTGLGGAFDGRIADAVAAGVVAGWEIAFLVGLLLFLASALLIQVLPERTEILDARITEDLDHGTVLPAYGQRRQRRFPPPPAPGTEA